MCNPMRSRYNPYNLLAMIPASGVKTRSFVVIHHSGTERDDVMSLRRFHQDTVGLSDIGYHFVITNGRVRFDIIEDSYDGVIQFGRPIQYDGYHCGRMDTKSIAICLVGPPYTEQQFNSLYMLCCAINRRRLEVSEVGMSFRGHRHLAQTACPEFELFDETGALNWPTPRNNEENNRLRVYITLP